MSTAWLSLTKEVDRVRTSVCLCWLCFLGKAVQRGSHTVCVCVWGTLSNWGNRSDMCDQCPVPCRDTVPALHSTPCEGHSLTPELSLPAVFDQSCGRWWLSIDPSTCQKCEFSIGLLGRQSQAMAPALVGTGIGLLSNRRTRRCP